MSKTTSVLSNSTFRNVILLFIRYSETGIENPLERISYSLPRSNYFRMVFYRSAIYRSLFVYTRSVVYKVTVRLHHTQSTRPYISNYSSYDVQQIVTQRVILNVPTIVSIFFIFIFFYINCNFAFSLFIFIRSPVTQIRTYHFTL